MVDRLGHMGILDIQVVVAGLDLVDGDLPGLFGFDPLFKPIGLAAPPGDLGLELRKAHGLGLVVAFDALGIGMLVVPDGFGGHALGEKKQVGLDAGVGVEHAVGQAHDGVQVALGEQFLLEPGFHALAEEKAVGQHHGGTALVF